MIEEQATKSYAARKREKRLRQKERAAAGVTLAHGEHATGSKEEIASRPARAAVATATAAVAAASTPPESKKRRRVPAGCEGNKRGAGSKERQQERRRQKRRAELAEAAIGAPSTLATSQGVPECGTS